MKILFVNWSQVEYAGGEKHLLSLIREMCKLGVMSRLLCPDKSPLAQRAAETGVDVSGICLNHFKKTNPWPYLNSVVSVYNEIKRFKPDLIHAQGFNSLHWLWPFQLLTRVPVAVVAQDFEILNRFSLWSFRMCDLVATVSESVRRHLIKTYNNAEGKSVVVYPGSEGFRDVSPTEVKAMRLRLGLGPDDVAVGICGRIHPIKSQDIFIEAARLLKRHGDIKWFIAGDRQSADHDFLNKLDAAIEQLNLKHQVIYTGFISDMAVFFKALDIVAVPSQNEPVGLISIEAQAAGRPIIVSANGGMPESVDDGRTGIVMRSLDADELAKQVLILAKDLILRKQMGQAGKERFVRRFKIHANAVIMLRLYRRLVGK